jgi:hypothetical protein
MASQRLVISGRKENACSRYELPKTQDIACYNRQSRRRHSLTRGDAEAIGIGGMNIDIRGLQDGRNIGPAAEKCHALGYFKGPGHLLKLRPKRSISDEEKMSIADRGKRSQNRRMILLRVETSNKNQPREIGWHKGKRSRPGGFKRVERNSVGNDADLSGRGWAPSNELFG